MKALTATLGALVLLLVVGGASYWAGHCAAGEGGESRWRAQVDSALGVRTQAWRQDSARWAHALEVAAKTADSAKVAAQDHAHRADSLGELRRAVVLPPVTPAACAPWAERLTFCEREVGSLRLSLTADSVELAARARLAAQAESTATAATRRAEDLAELLRTRPRAGWRPPKWAVAAVGCTAGALLHQADPLEGCGAAGLLTVVLVPTR